VVGAEELQGGQLGRTSQFCAGVCEERTCAREAEESLLLEAAARERLVKTAEWKSLSWCCSDL
jgi:hypothetical protein